MDIDCYLLSEGKFEASRIPQELLIELSKNLRSNGIETVHFANRSVQVEGVYIPARGIKNRLLIISDEDEE